MLQGVDVSHYQSASMVKAWAAQSDFMFFKASEGVTYHDNKLKSYWMLADAAGVWLRGLYHYAHPETNDAYTEAANFVAAVKKVLPTMDGNTILALDWEGKALKYKSDWAVKWMHTVGAMTGVKPIIYTQPWNAIDKCAEVARGDFGLWFARYNGNPLTNGKRIDKTKIPNISPWKVWAFYQWTSTPLDMDIFNGSERSFRLYAKVNG